MLNGKRVVNGGPKSQRRLNLARQALPGQVQSSLRDFGIRLNCPECEIGLQPNILRIGADKDVEFAGFDDPVLGVHIVERKGATVENEGGLTVAESPCCCTARI